MPQLKVQNFYSTVLTSDIVGTGDTSFTVTTPPTYTSGFLVISPSNASLREIVYFHNVVGSTISVRAENRGQGGTTAKAHTSQEPVAMKDIAEIFNMFSDAISQCFFVEKTGGLNIKVWGGTVFYNGNPVTVADTTLALADNQTNYIKYSYPTNTISVDTVNSGNIKARVITLAGVITSIQYYVAKESYIDFTVTINGALPSQVGQAGKFLGTDGTNVSWQNALPDQTGNLGKFLGTDGTNASWQIAGALTGEMKVWPISTIPAGYLLCDGTAVSRTTYALLMAAIAPTKGTFAVTIATPGVITLNSHGMVAGDSFYATTTGALPTGIVANTLYYVSATGLTANTFQLSASRGGSSINTTGSQSGTHTLVYCPFGLGNGSTTFNVPNTKGRTVVGLDNTQSEFQALSVTSGAKTHTLSISEIPSHDHAGTYYSSNYTNPSASFIATAMNTSPVASSVPAQGGGAAHNNLQPSITLNYIIKT